MSCTLVYRLPLKQSFINRYRKYALWLKLINKTYKNVYFGIYASIKWSFNVDTMTSSMKDHTYCTTNIIYFEIIEDEIPLKALL